MATIPARNAIPKVECMDKQPPNKKDAILHLARVSLGDKRRRTPAHIALLIGVPAIVIALLVWWIYPKPALPALLLAAFDQVALPDEVVPLQARVEPVVTPETPTDLTGCQLFFLDMSSGRLLGKVSSGRDGWGAIETKNSAASSPYEMLVRFPGEENRRRSDQSGSQLYVWPAESSILVVDADRILAGVDDVNLWTQHNLDIRPRADAAASLRSNQVSYRIVYLAVSAASPSRYNKLRGWMGYVRASSTEAFPPGPLLAPAALPQIDDDFHKLIVGSLTKRFTGKLVGCTDDAIRAKLFHDSGLRSFLLSKTAESAEGIEVVKTWKELAEKLAKK